MHSSLQVVIDVVCPWCFIGKRRLDQTLNASTPSIEWLPLELDPSMPAEGANREAYRSRRFGSLEKSQAMDARARAAGEQVGIGFRYELMTRTPNTLKAHRLIWLARKQDLQNEVVEAIFRAYFMEGKDVGDTLALVDLAAASGLDRALVSAFLQSSDGVKEVRDLIRQAETLNIRGVPTLLRDGVVVNNGFQFIDKIISGEHK